MKAALFCVALAAGLFASSFFAKRRFGLLGLALATGSLLSSIWAFDAGLITSALGFPTNIFVSSVTAMVIILLPALVLLFHGYTYNNIIGRTIGACLFTLLAMAFLIEPLGKIMSPSGFGAELVDWLVGNKAMIIGAGLIIAVVDLFLTKPVSNKKKR